LVIPAIKGITLALEEIGKNLTSPESRIFFDGVKKQVEGRLYLYEERSISRIATFLDPRFKSKGFRLESNFKEAKKLVQNALRIELQSEASKNKPTLSVVENEPSSSRQNCTQSTHNSIFSFVHDVSNIGSSSASFNATVEATIIVDNYLRADTVGQDVDPMANIKDYFPKLLNTAKTYLQTPGTSVPSECLFSSTGQLVTERRSKLTAENIKKLCFLHKNYNLL